MFKTISGWLAASVIFYMMARVIMWFTVPAAVWAIQMAESGSLVWGMLGILSLGATLIVLGALAKAGVSAFKTIAV